MKRTENGRRYVNISIILNLLGITSVTAIKDQLGYFGYVLIAVGILFFFLGMKLRKKKRRKKVNKKKEKIKTGVVSPLS